MQLAVGRLALLMSDPISTFVDITGEPAVISLPGVAVPFDPNAPGDYDPDEGVQPKTYPVQGVPETRKVLEETGYSAGFTIEAVSLPTVLLPYATDPEKVLPDEATLLWREVCYTIKVIRERHFRGEVNGYTFYLKA